MNSEGSEYLDSFTEEEDVGTMGNTNDNKYEPPIEEIGGDIESNFVTSGDDQYEPPIIIEDKAPSNPKGAKEELLHKDKQESSIIRNDAKEETRDRLKNNEDNNLPYSTEGLGTIGDRFKKSKKNNINSEQKNNKTANKKDDQYEPYIEKKNKDNKLNSITQNYDEYESPIIEDIIPSNLNDNKYESPIEESVGDIESNFIPSGDDQYEPPIEEEIKIKDMPSGDFPGWHEEEYGLHKDHKLGILSFFDKGKYFMYLMLTLLAVFIVQEFKDMIDGATSGSVIDVVYLVIFSLMGIYASIQATSIYKILKSLKDSNQIKKQLQAKGLEKSELINISQMILDNYENSPYNSEELESEMNVLKQKKNDSLKKDLEDYLCKDFGNVIDKKAKKIIADSAVSIGVTTAISPVPLFDMMLVFIRTYDMSKKIAILYGYKPSPIANLFLIKNAIRNIAFAGISEVAIDIGIDSFASTTFSKMASKLSMSAAQGIINARLMSRLGINIAEECRPIPRKLKYKEIYKEVYENIMNKINSTK